jgi:small GTP-binding protein
MSKDYDVLIKVIIIGDSGVGKSSIMGRRCDNVFQPTFVSTIGVDFKYTTVTIDGKTVKLQIWDTAGQERFRVITAAYYRSADVAILAYDVTDKKSFDHVPIWLNECTKYAKESLRKILIGNKADSADRAVSYEQGQKLAADNGILFAETSAKKDIGISEAFQAITKDYLSFSCTDHNKQRKKDSIVLSKKNGQTKSPTSGRKNCFF